MSRPIILHERIPLPSAPVANQGVTVKADASLLNPPEAMRVDYIVLEEESGFARGVRVRAALREREFWTSIPTEMSTFNNIVRDGDPTPEGDEQGEYWLGEPYLLRRGHTINIEVENRIVGPGGQFYRIQGQLLFQGEGITSKRPYDLVVPFDVPAGTLRRTFGANQNVKVSGREDILIKALCWSRVVDTQAWNSRFIGLGVKPSYGQQWHGNGGTARGGGSLLPPLYVYGNVRGPRVAAFYKPTTPLLLEQGDEITFEFENRNQGAPGTFNRVVLLTIVGTSIAGSEIKTPVVPAEV